MDLKEIAIRIIGDIDYDMEKAATLYEVEEWESTVNTIIGRLEEVFNEGYNECLADHGLDGP